MAEIYAVNIYETISERQYRWLFSTADNSRKSRALRYRLPDDQKRCIYAGALLRYALSDKTNVHDINKLYTCNEYGKPYLHGISGVYFNISHSGSWVVCGVANAEIGVDIEKMEPMGADIARSFFHPREYEALQAIDTLQGQCDAFYSLWTLKESYIKYTGTGMSMPLDSFYFELGGGCINLHSLDAFAPHCQLFDIDQKHKLAVCTDDHIISGIKLVALESICTELAG